METNYKGIDYGSGKTNIDLETGIRYGVINQNEVGESWFDSSEAIYPNEVFCPECGNELTLVSEGKSEQLPDNQGVSVEDDIYYCDNCNKDIYESDLELDFIEPIEFIYNQDGYQCNQFADDTDIFITKSPYFTYCQFCSPCAPGAGYLMNYYKPENDTKEIQEQFNTLQEIAPKAIPEAYKSYAEKAGFPKVYCFGHDWFEDNKAPYPVYSVETGELIEAEKA